MCERVAEHGVMAATVDGQPLILPPALQASSTTESSSGGNRSSSVKSTNATLTESRSTGDAETGPLVPRKRTRAGGKEVEEDEAEEEPGEDVQEEQQDDGDDEAGNGLTRPAKIRHRILDSVLQQQQNESAEAQLARRLQQARTGRKVSQQQHAGLATATGSTGNGQQMSPGKQLRQSTYEASKARHAEWQRQYRRAFPLFHFYFDHVDDHTKRKVTRLIASLGGHTETFFSSAVTHVITTRELPEGPRAVGSATAANALADDMSARSRQGSASLDEPFGKADVLCKAQQLKMKIWSLEKLVDKVLGNLITGVSSAMTTTTQSPQADLSHLLRDEKVYGTRERDPKAARADIIYFKGPYLHVRDLHGQYRSIMSREYPKTYPNGREPWPMFRQTAAGRCPFVIDRYRERQLADKAAADEKLDSQVKPREERPPAVRALQDSTNRRLNLEATSRATAQRHGLGNAWGQENRGNRQQHRLPPAPEVNASGMFQSNVTSAIRSMAPLSRSATATANTTSGGSHPNGTKNYPKGLNMMQLRVVQHNATTAGKTAAPAAETTKAKPRPQKPGFCENCREKYDDFDTHISSRYHRRFADDESNFDQLDEFLQHLKRPLRASGTNSEGVYDLH